MNDQTNNNTSNLNNNEIITIPIDTKIPFKTKPDIMEYGNEISAILFSMESINTTYIDPTLDEIPIQIMHPFQHNITAIADTGANINAISLETAQLYKDKFIHTANRSFKVRTGGGYITCQQYIPFGIKQDDYTMEHVKFWIIPDLPFEYLIGRNLIRRLGYKLTKIENDDEFHHKRENLDCFEDEDIINPYYPVGRAKNSQSKTECTPKYNISNRHKKLNAFIKKALMDYQEICAKSEFDIGQIPDSEFKIIFKNNVDTTPIRCAEYPHNVLNIAEIERQLAHLVGIGLITAGSESPWRSPTFIVPKKNGEARIVFDYRLLNAITERMGYSLPSIEQLMNNFQGMNYISTIDIKSGYWHIPIRKEDRPKTAFVFNNKTYEWNVMPFGPTNAPPHFQKIMDKIFNDLPFVMVYMDDITVISKTPKEHMAHLEAVFKRLSKYKIKIRPDKCAFAQSSVPYLGFEVNGKGIQITPKYKDKIQNIPIPTTIKQMQRFIGMVQYLHKFIPNLQSKLAPFHAMTQKNAYFKWNQILDRSFHEIKTIIMETEMVRHPDLNKTFHVFCDASGKGIGAVLTQLHDGDFVPVQFSSKLFNKTQQNWHVSEQEIYAAIHSVEKWRQYLIGKHFYIHTDHQNLRELFNRAKNFKAGKLYRWAVRLQEYDFTAKHIKGSKNVMPDYLSRDGLIPAYTSDPEPKKVNTSDICSLYIHHLCMTTNAIKPYNPHRDDVMGTSDDESDSDNDIDMMPSPNASPTPITQMPSPNNSPEPTTFDNNSEIDHSEIDHSENDIDIQPKPYNTRLHQKHKLSHEHQVNLKRDLIEIQDPNYNIPYDKPINKSLSGKSPYNTTELSNRNTIDNKYNYQKYNKRLLDTSPDQINDEYNLNEYGDKYKIQTIKRKQNLDPWLYFFFATD